MPLTDKGEKIKGAMSREYGEKKGEQVFYASRNAGTISGVDSEIADRGDADESYWTYKAGSPTPSHKKATGSGAFRGSETDWHSMSPGMRREIVRQHERGRSDASTSEMLDACVARMDAMSAHLDRLERRDAERRVQERNDAPLSHMDGKIIRIRA